MSNKYRREKFRLLYNITKLNITIKQGRDSLQWWRCTPSFNSLDSSAAVAIHCDQDTTGGAL